MLLKKENDILSTDHYHDQVLFSCPHGGGETAWQIESRASP